MGMMNKIYILCHFLRLGQKYVQTYKALGKSWGESCRKIQLIKAANEFKANWYIHKFHLICFNSRKGLTQRFFQNISKGISSTIGWRTNEAGEWLVTAPCISVQWPHILHLRASVEYSASKTICKELCSQCNLYNIMHLRASVKYSASKTICKKFCSQCNLYNILHLKASVEHSASKTICKIFCSQSDLYNILHQRRSLEWSASTTVCKTIYTIFCYTWL